MSLPLPASITSSRRRLLLDGVPRLALAGEIHYFRVPRAEWEQRLDLLTEAGCTAVATYIPWMWHELPDGSIDLEGRTRPERDLAAFLDLCARRGLPVIARPGPFQMAELLHEGIPERVRREHPEILPTGWDDVPAPTAAIDYLAPAFLAEVERWYAAVMPLLAEHLAPHGGPVVAVQLDNEIGMLAWVSNSPDLSDHLLAELRGWVREHRPGAESTYPALRADADAWARAVRAPEEAWAGPLRTDLGRFMRGRFARYVQHLRGLAEAHGVRRVPFLINIHGTSAGSGEPFGIGVSQLMETYAGIPGMLAGSDHYLGPMSLTATTDLYVMNAIQQAVNGPDQALTSLEFEVGSGDYGGGMDEQLDPSTADLKLRLFLAQGTRLVNLYLLAGGINPVLAEGPEGGPAAAPADGSGRISFTGERHGTAAPITPEGGRAPTFAPLARALAAARLHERHLASAEEELDDISLAFIPDAFATEYVHPGSARMEEVARELRDHRGAGQRRALARSALLRGFRFDARVLPDRGGEALADGPALGLRPEAPARVLMVATSRHMDPAVQAELVAHLEADRSLLLLGPVPEQDLDGEPCRILADHLRIAPREDLTWDRPGWFPTVQAHGWAAPMPQTRVSWVQDVAAEDAEVVLSDLQGRAVGLDISLPAGRAVLLSAGLPSHPGLFGAALDRLGARPGIPLTSSVPGVFTTSTRDEADGRMVHVLNTTGYRPEVRLGIGADGADDAPLVLRPAPRTGYLLAAGIRISGAWIERANADLVEIGEDRLVFGEPAGDEAVVRFGIGRSVAAAHLSDGSPAHVEQAGGAVVVRGPGVLTVDLG